MADEATTAPTLETAIDHLQRFAWTFNPGEEVDEESELVADDLNVILEHLKRTKDMVFLKEVDLNDPGATEALTGG